MRCVNQYFQSLDYSRDLGLFAALVVVGGGGYKNRKLRATPGASYRDLNRAAKANNLGIRGLASVTTSVRNVLLNRKRSAHATSETSW